MIVFTPAPRHLAEIPYSQSCSNCRHRKGIFSDLKDRDVLRFLWVENVSQEQPKLLVLRSMRVVFGVSSSPFLLNTTIKHHMESFTPSHPKLVKDLCCVVLCLCLFVCLFLSTCHFEIHYLSIHLIIITVTKSL